MVEQRTGVECAGWGGILSNAARLKGLSGVIVEGLGARCGRSGRHRLSRLRPRPRPPAPHAGRIHEAETGGPIQVGDLTVNDGDWVVADSSGAAFVPADRIAEVLDAAERIAAKEAVMTKAVLAGPAGQHRHGRQL